MKNEYESNNLNEGSKGSSGSRKKNRAAASNLADRMVAAHRRRKREEKIKKLESDGTHWKGLE